MRWTMTKTFPLFLAFACLLASCTSQPTPTTAPKKLESAQLGSIKRLHVLDGIYLAGQPEPDDFKLARQRGIKTIVNLRMDGEISWDEAGLVEELGFEYHQLGFMTPASLRDEIFDKARGLINDRDNHPMMIHCKSANRVGAIWLAYRTLDGDLSFDQALAEAETVGLSNLGYVQRAQDYIRAKQ